MTGEPIMLTVTVRDATGNIVYQAQAPWHPDPAVPIADLPGAGYTVTWSIEWSSDWPKR